MTYSFASSVYWQIQSIVASLSQKNSKKCKGELSELCGAYGHRSTVFLISCLLKRVNLREFPGRLQDSSELKLDSEDCGKIELLSEYIEHLWKLGRLSFGTRLRSALLGAIQLTDTQGFVEDEDKKSASTAENMKLGKYRSGLVTVTFLEVLCKKLLKLSPEQQLCFALALSQSTDGGISGEGAKLLASVLFGLTEASNLSVDIDIATQIVAALKTHSVFRKDPDLGKSCMLALENTLPDVWKRVESAPYAVESVFVDSIKTGGALLDEESPCLIETDEGISSRMWKEIGLAGILRDVGPVCTRDPKLLQGILTNVCEVKEYKFTIDDISNVIGMMACTQSSLAQKDVAADEMVQFQPGGFVFEEAFGNLNIRENGTDGAKAVVTQETSTSDGTVTNHSINRKGDSSLASSGGENDKIESYGWNVQNFLRVVEEFCEGSLDANLIIARLGECCEELNPSCVDKDAFQLIVNAYRFLKGGKPLRGMLFLDCTGVPGRLWRNRAAQMALLMHAVDSPADTVLFSTAGTGRHSIIVPKGVPTNPNRAWSMLDFVATLETLAGAGYYSFVTKIMKDAVDRYPETLLLGLLSTPPNLETLREEIFAILLPKLFTSMLRKDEPVVPREEALVMAWQLNHNVLLRSMVAMYARDAKFLRLFVEFVRQQNGGLRKMLALPYPRFVLDAAMCASRTGQANFNFGEWLKTFISSKAGFFLELDSVGRAICQILATRDRKGGFEYDKGDLHVLVTTVTPLFSVQPPLPFASEQTNRATVHAATSSLEPQKFEETILTAESAAAKEHQTVRKAIKEGVSDPNATLSDVGDERHRQGSSSTGDEIPSGRAEPDPVTDQAHAFLQNIYRSQRTGGEIVEMFAKLKKSEAGLNSHVFDRVVHVLLDEYRFLRTYPEKERKTTAILFGAMIQSQFVASAYLGTAIRHVVEALHQPPQSPMFKFGLTALRYCATRLVAAYPQVAEAISKIESLRRLHPEIVLDLEKASRSINPGGAGGDFANPLADSRHDGQMSHTYSVPVFAGRTGAGGGHIPLRGTEKSPEAVAAVKRTISDLVRCHAELSDIVPAPSTDVEDRLGFLINNLTKSKIDEKVAEFRQILVPEHQEWMAYYLVVKRVASQPNLQCLYQDFLNKVSIAGFSSRVLCRTLYAVRRSLLSNDIVTSASERSALRNLGAWLGKLTLGSNLPLLHRDLDIKGLIVDGYERGWLISILPFVSKILEGSTSSTVFTVSNPWMHAVLCLLHEVYCLPGLKLNLKFEIEVLCKALSCDIANFNSSDILSSRCPPLLHDNPDFVAAKVEDRRMQMQSHDISDGQIGSDSRVQPGLGNQSRKTLQQYQQDHVPLSPTLETQIPNLSNFVHINGSIKLFQEQPALTRLVPLAVDRAIREIIEPVVERSVTVACRTTIEIALKDFAMEPDEDRLRNGAHLMVSSLAGALALVTCKEPFRESLGNHIRSLLQRAMKAGESASLELIDQAVLVCVSENLELGYQLIEKAAIDKSSRAIREKIEPAVALRIEGSKHGRPYVDAQVLKSGQYPRELPNSLYPTPSSGGLQQRHLMVYGTFQRSHRHISFPSSHSSLASLDPKVVHGAASHHGADMSPALRGPVSTASLGKSATETANSLQLFERWGSCLNELDHCVLSLTNGTSGEPLPSINRLHKDHPIHILLGEIHSIAMSRIHVDSANSPRADDDSHLAGMIRQSFKRLFENAHSDKLQLEIYLAILVILVDVLSKQMDPTTGRRYLTELLINMPIELKLNRAWATVGLIKSRLLFLPEFDIYMSKLTAKPNGLRFVLDIIRSCVVDNQYAGPGDFPNTLNVVKKLIASRNHQGLGANAPSAHEGLVSASQLFEDLQELNYGIMQGDLSSHLQPTATTGPNFQKREPVPVGQFIRSKDSPALLQDFAKLLHQWIRLCSSADLGSIESLSQAYCSLMQQPVLKKNAGAISSFFRICIELSIESYLSQTDSSTTSGGSKSGVKYLPIDYFCRLVVLHVQYTPLEDQTTVARKLVKMICAVMCREVFLRREFSVENEMDQRPYFRLLMNLQRDLVELYESKNRSEDQILSLLEVFADVYKHELSPIRIPGFTFAWLELVGCRHFMPKLLLGVQYGKGWNILGSLVVELLEFMSPLLQETIVSPSARVLYIGTLRVLLVLLHDFPEFLCAFHFSFCNAIPSSCVQLRNLILSAFPRSTQLPDPFTPDLNVDELPDTQSSPRLLSNYVKSLLDHGLKNELDVYLETGQPVQFGMAVLKAVSSPSTGPNGGGYNIPLINSLVLYVGVHAISKLLPLAYAENKSTTLMQIINQSSSSVHSITLLSDLISVIEPDGRYCVLNAMANQLRFPSAHTHFFSCAILNLFENAKTDIVREHITRVLLERLIVHRPHPWGLLITFMELIKNKKYRFWDYSFTKCTPEIRRLFESVAHKCIDNNNAPSAAKAKPQTAAVSLSD